MLCPTVSMPKHPGTLYGIVKGEGRKAVRAAMYEAAQASFTNPLGLLKALSPQTLWDLSQLVQPADHDRILDTGVLH